MESKIKILPEEERKIIENGMELSRIQKVIDVINKEPKKELIVFIDVRNDEMYNVFDIKENGKEELLPLDESVVVDFKITKDELRYMETQLLTTYSIAKQKFGEIIIIEMSPK